MNMSEPTTLVTGLIFPEGPRWYDGYLYFSDMFGREVFRYRDGTGLESVCSVAEQPSGLGHSADGDLLIASMLDRRILILRNGTQHEFADLSELCPGPINDMIDDGRGGTYVGNFGYYPESPGSAMVPTRLVYVDPAGVAATVGEPIMFPNGTVITDGGRTLLVAETFNCRILAFAIADDGSLSDRRVWADFHKMRKENDLAEALDSGGILPDGICIDRDGALWVADAGGQGALRIAEGGEILDQVPAPEGLSVFAVALGGEEGNTLYLCAGLPMNSPEQATARAGVITACDVVVPGVQ